MLYSGVDDVVGGICAKSANFQPIVQHVLEYLLRVLMLAYPTGISDLTRILYGYRVQVASWAD
jgi:hypothetical protein